jgi:hypothetical protein
MRVRQLVMTVLAVGVLVGPPVRAADGVLVVQRTTSDGKASMSEVQLEAQRMRTQLDGPGGPQVIVFDGAKQVMYTMNPARKSYTEMTKADVERMGSELSGAMAQMQEMLKSMPPEQRAKMEAMMKGQGMPASIGAAPARTQYKKTGTSTVAKWACDTYDGLQNGQKVSEVCTVSPQALGLRPADFAISAQMAEFFRGLVPQGADAIFQIGRPEANGFAGVPVRHAMTIAGRTTVYELVDVSRRTFDDAIFAVPAGFTKEASPFVRR